MGSVRDHASYGNLVFPHHIAIPEGLTQHSSLWSKADLQFANKIIEGNVHVSRVNQPREEGWSGGGVVFLPGVEAKDVAMRFALHDRRNQWLPHMSGSHGLGQKDIDPGPAIAQVTHAKYRMEPLGFLLGKTHTWLHNHLPAALSAPLAWGSYTYNQFESERLLHNADGLVVGYSFDWRCPTEAEEKALKDETLATITLSTDLSAKFARENDASTRDHHQEEKGSFACLDWNQGCLVTYHNLTRMKGWKEFSTSAWTYLGIPQSVYWMGWRGAEYYYRVTLEGIKSEMNRGLTPAEKRSAEDHLKELLATPHVQLGPQETN